MSVSTKADHVLTLGLGEASQRLTYHLLHALKRKGVFTDDDIDIIFGTARERSQSEVAQFLLETWENRFFASGDALSMADLKERDDRFAAGLSKAALKDLQSLDGQT